MRDQFMALMELKWRLYRRTFRGAKAVTTVVRSIFLGLFAVAGVGLGIALYLVCSQQLRADDRLQVLIVTDVCVGVFLMVWFMGLMGELQRSDIVDFRKMLYLPVSLPMVFVLNYCASLFSPILCLYIPAVLGASLGLTVRFGAHMLLAIPLAALFYLMVAAWSYYAQGLIAAVMENKRRRRAIVAVISLLMVAIGQAPNLLSVFFHNKQIAAAQTVAHHLNEHFLTVTNLGVPFGWLPYSVHALAQGHALGVLFGLVAMPALAMGGLGLGLRSTWRYYTGAGGKKKASRKSPTVATAEGGAGVRRTLLDRTLPWIEDDTCAIVWVSLLNYLRHPNLRMMLVMPVIFVAIFGGSYVMRAHAGAGPNASALLMGALLIPFLNLSVLVLNTFGADEGGFRAFVLLPAERKKYLIGKNIATFAFVAVAALPLMFVAAILGGASAASVLTAVLLLPSLYLLLCAAGNPIAVRFPYRIQWDGMRNKSVSGSASLASLLSLPLIMLMGALAAGCLFIVPLLAMFLRCDVGQWLGLTAALVLLLLTTGLYFLALGPTARLLARREQAILDAVRRDRE